MKKNKEPKMATIKTIGGGEFSIEFTNSRDFVNSIRASIERGSLYEFTLGTTRTFINCANIVSVELESEALAPYSPFKNQAITAPTEDEIRETQLAMQPDLVKFEAKAKAMEKMKAKEDAQRQAQFDAIYGKDRP